MIAVTSRRACARSAERWAPAFAGGANKLVVCWNAMQAIAAPLLLALALLSLPAAAAQAQSVNPTKNAVSEQQLLQQSRTIRGLGSIPDAKSYTLEQPAGRDWRHFHEVTLRWIGGIAILGMLAVLVFFYLSRGMVRIEAVGLHYRALQLVRAVRALDDGGLLRRPCALRAQHHLPDRCSCL